MRFSDVLETDSVCEYKENVYVAGEQWRDGECRNCTCENGGHTICSEFECPPCDSSPIQLDGLCCPPCPGMYELSLNEHLFGVCQNFFNSRIMRHWFTDAGSGWLSIGKEHPMRPRGENGIEYGAAEHPVNLVLLGTTVGLLVAIVVAVMLICYLVSHAFCTLGVRKLRYNCWFNFRSSISGIDVIRARSRSSFVKTRPLAAHSFSLQMILVLLWW